MLSKFCTRYFILRSIWVLRHGMYVGSKLVHQFGLNEGVYANSTYFNYLRFHRIRRKEGEK